MFKSCTFATSILASAILCGCAASGAVPMPFPVPGGSRAPARTRVMAPLQADAYAVTSTALSLRGVPYRNGGNDPSGFDCSGFIWYVFAQHGIQVGRTVGEQMRQGIDIRADAVQTGDLVFFATTERAGSHVGMMIGGDEFVHAPSSRGEVRVDRLSAGYWARRLVAARRII